MQRDKKTWVLKEDGKAHYVKLEGWTFEVGALTDLKFFTLKINGRHFLEHPQTKLEYPGAGSNWDEACAIGGHIEIMGIYFTGWL